VSGESGPLDAVLAQLADLRDQVTLLEAAQQHDAERIAELTAALQDDADGGAAYRPVPAPRWWQLRGRERDEATARLRAWTETVFRPGYGHLAARLGPCWEQHDLCLYLLDWLSESWTVIFHPARRSQSALWTSADWHTRFLPAAAALLEAETGSCDHLVPGTAEPRAGAR